MSDRNLEVRRARPIRPASYCAEQEGRFILELDMPGVTRENLELHVEEGQLRITGRRADRQESGTYLLRERPRGDYETAYTLDETIDTQKIDAKLAEGVLVVTLNLKEAVKPRRIQVKTG